MLNYKQITNGITEEHPAISLFNYIWSKAFTALAEYTGWPISHINDMLSRYEDVDNVDYLQDVIAETLEHTRDHNIDDDVVFYINTDDVQLLDAFADYDNECEIICHKSFTYNSKDPDVETELITVYTDPITGIKFKFFID